MNKRLDFLQRRNTGKLKIKNYQSLFTSSCIRIAELEYVDLELSDQIIQRAREVFTKIQRKSESLRNDCIFIDSDLMRNVYLNLSEADACYIYTDDFGYCGMFKVKAKLGFEIALNIARDDFQNTCYLLDEQMKYSFTINHYDESHNDQPNSFDIQLWVNPN